MNKPEVNQTSPNIDNVRRKLLKLGIYSVPAILLIGKATGAKASGGNKPVGPRKDNDDNDCNILEQIISLGKWC